MQRKCVKKVSGPSTLMSRVACMKRTNAATLGSQQLCPIVPAEGDLYTPQEQQCHGTPLLGGGVVGVGESEPATLINREKPSASVRTEPLSLSPSARPPAGSQPVLIPSRNAGQNSFMDFCSDDSYSDFSYSTELSEDWSASASDLEMSVEPASPARQGAGPEASTGSLQGLSSELKEDVREHPFKPSDLLLSPGPSDIESPRGLRVSEGRPGNNESLLIKGHTGRIKKGKKDKGLRKKIDLQSELLGDSGSQQGSKSEKKRDRSGRVRGVRANFLTWNNYTEDDIVRLLAYAKLYCTKWAFQEEVGLESGTRHLQGNFYFKSQVKCETLATDLKGSFWRPTANPRAADMYCLKDETRPNGGRQWVHGIVIKNKAMPFYYTLKDHKPWPWQQFIIDLISQPANRRAIYWIYDPVGSNGKSDLCIYLCHVMSCIMVSHLENDCACAIKNFLGVDDNGNLLPVEEQNRLNGVICDIPRVEGKRN